LIDIFINYKKIQTPIFHSVVLKQVHHIWGMLSKLKKKDKKIKKIFCESNAKTHVRTIYRGMRINLKKTEINLNKAFL